MYPAGAVPDAETVTTVLTTLVVVKDWVVLEVSIELELIVEEMYPELNTVVVVLLAL